MAKTINQKPINTSPFITGGETFDSTNSQRTAFSPVQSFPFQAFLIALIAICFYMNTCNNEMAFDDNIVITRNEYVLQGVSGIPGLLTNDGYESYYRQFNAVNQLAGGRYRPLSMISFAIEQQFLGPIPVDKLDSVLHHELAVGMNGAYEQKLIHDMHIRHFMNVLWFTLSVIVLLYFLRFIIFPRQPVIAFLATLLFTIHPIHTEVVANVKSRDEIMSLLFISLTFIFGFKYLEHKKRQLLLLALLCYFLAFLSKEYAITLVALLPLAFYLFSGYTIRKSLMASLPYYAVALAYVFIRFSIVSPMSESAETNVLNNPYANTEGLEKIATEIATSLNYLKLLIYPHPLSFDYSYNQIPYKNFSNPFVWISIIVYTGIIVGIIWFFKKRSVLCFAFSFYLLNLLMVCNVFFDIGATMGERLIYHSSVGFSIALAWLLYKGMEKIKPAKTGRILLSGLVVVLVVLCGFTTINRNRDWKNNTTLFTHDLKISPNSVLVNINVAISLMNSSDYEKDPSKKKEDLLRSIELFNKALTIHPTYDKAYLNKSLAWFRLGQFDSVLSNLNRTRQLYANHPQLPDIYYNLGIAFSNNREFEKAIQCWQITLQLNPGYANARNQIDNLKMIKEQAADTINNSKTK